MCSRFFDIGSFFLSKPQSQFNRELSSESTTDPEAGEDDFFDATSRASSGITIGDFMAHESSSDPRARHTLEGSTGDEETDVDRVHTRNAGGRASQLSGTHIDFGSST